MKPPDGNMKFYMPFLPFQQDIFLFVYAQRGKKPQPVKNHRTVVLECNKKLKFYDFQTSVSKNMLSPRYVIAERESSKRTTRTNGCTQPMSSNNSSSGNREIALKNVKCRV